MVETSRPVDADRIQPEVNTRRSIYETVSMMLRRRPTDIPNEAPQYSWQKSKMPSNTGLSSLYKASTLEGEGRRSTRGELILVLIYDTRVNLL